MILITLKIELTPQDINDIICTAIEGGIGYWSDTYKAPLEINRKLRNKMPKDKNTQAYDVIGYGGVIDLHDGTR